MVLASDGSDKNFMRNVNISRVLGRGTFGIVQQVTVEDGSPAALKSMTKIKLNSHELDVAETELKVLVQFPFPFIVHFLGAWEDAQYIHLLLEYCPGGDMYTLMQLRHNQLPVTAVWFYLREIVLTIEHLHGNNVIMGDLKPENVLIDEEGHVKLADFGMSECDTHMRSGLTRAPRGTPEYQSPEQMLGRPYGHPADIWSLGCVAYEMMCGELAFFSSRKEVTLRRIMKRDLPFPRAMPGNVRDWLLGMLHPDPARRFDIAQVKQHCVFARVNWDDVLGRKLPAPWIPSIDGNFADEFTSMPTLEFSETVVTFAPAATSSPIEQKPVDA